MNFYAPVFILYELSTPFLNVHWFCDKLNLTGSKIQLYNGIALLVTFASCRLIYGSFQSILVYMDMWRAVQAGPDAGYIAAAHTNSTMADPNINMMAFAKDSEPIPIWLASIYVASNVVLNTLNWHWFFKMIAAVRKRFEPAKKEKPMLDSAGVPDGSGGSSTSVEKVLQETRKRRNTLEVLTPDSEELREGTIQ